jgi:hypothetical protein
MPSKPTEQNVYEKSPDDNDSRCLGERHRPRPARWRSGMGHRWESFGRCGSGPAVNARTSTGTSLCGAASLRESRPGRGSPTRHRRLPGASGATSRRSTTGSIRPCTAAGRRPTTGLRATSAHGHLSTGARRLRRASLRPARSGLCSPGAGLLPASSGRLPLFFRLTASLLVSWYPEEPKTDCPHECTSCGHFSFVNPALVVLSPHA